MRALKWDVELLLMTSKSWVSIFLTRNGSELRAHYKQHTWLSKQCLSCWQKQSFIGWDFFVVKLKNKVRPTLRDFETRWCCFKAYSYSFFCRLGLLKSLLTKLLSSSYLQIVLLPHLRSTVKGDRFFAKVYFSNIDGLVSYLSCLTMKGLQL